VANRNYQPEALPGGASYEQVFKRLETNADNRNRDVTLAIADYTVQASDDLVLTQGAITVTLRPGSAGPNTLTVRNTDTVNAITIAAQGSDTIEGFATITVIFSQAVRLVFDGRGTWWLI
jgi:hypothetical protein